MAKLSVQITAAATLYLCQLSIPSLWSRWKMIHVIVLWWHFTFRYKSDQWTTVSLMGCNATYIPHNKYPSFQSPSQHMYSLGTCLHCLSASILTCVWLLFHLLLCVQIARYGQCRHSSNSTCTTQCIAAEQLSDVTPAESYNEPARIDRYTDPL